MKAALGRYSWPIAGTWLAFFVAIALALPQPPDPLRLGGGALLGILIIILGFRAAARCRRVTPQAPRKRTIRAACSFLAGALLGGLLLALLVFLASKEPFLRGRFAGRAGEPAWRPFALAFESSIIEEVVFRLFIMSVAAWAFWRLMRRHTTAFGLAWGLSSLLFGLAHLPQWLLLTPPSPSVIATVLALNGAGGLLFGWIFWRWGLLYAILCHATGDVIIQSLAPKLLKMDS